MNRNLIIYITALVVIGVTGRAMASVTCEIEYSEGLETIDARMLLPIDACIKKMEAEKDPKRTQLKSKVLETLNKAKKDCGAVKLWLRSGKKEYPTEDKGRPTWCEDPDLGKVQEALAAYNAAQSAGAVQKAGGAAGQGSASKSKVSSLGSKGGWVSAKPKVPPRETVTLPRK